MGILKKSGSWKTNKHNRRITFGCEEYSTGETPKKVKLHDGMSEKNRSWYNFIDIWITLQLDPEIAWKRVPEKYLNFVWNTIVDMLDKYCLNSYAISMPLGHPKCFGINKKYHIDIEVLGKWVYEKITKQPYQKPLEKKKKICQNCKIGYLEYDEKFDKSLCYLCDDEIWKEGNDENWDRIKENCSKSPRSIIPEYPDVITLHSEEIGDFEI
jgi:hypothetical protein